MTIKYNRAVYGELANIKNSSITTNKAQSVLNETVNMKANDFEDLSLKISNLCLLMQQIMEEDVSDIKSNIDDTFELDRKLSGSWKGASNE